MKTINPNVEILGRYNLSSEKILTKCLICENEWYITPNHLKNGKGCPKCAIRNRADNRKKSNEDFIKELNKINPNIMALDTYNSSKTPLKFICKIHNHEWVAKPYSVLSGSGCPICGVEKIKKSQRKSNEDFIKELNKINPNIRTLNQYVNSKTDILCKCLIDGHEWITKPSFLLQGTGCPICGNKRTGESLHKSHEQFVKELNEVNSNIEVLDKYTYALNKILCYCKICNHKWYAYPNNLLSGSGCPKCVRPISTHIEFVEELYKRNSKIKVLGEYIKSSIHVLCECKKCEHKWYATPNSLLLGSGCPRCKQSKGERKIDEILKKYNINFEIQKKFNGLYGLKNHQLSYDFYLPNYNLLIEYNGIQHYQSIKFFGGDKQFELQQYNDKSKKDFAKNNNISLIIIPYWNYKNIESIILEKLDWIKGELNNVN